MISYQDAAEMLVQLETRLRGEDEFKTSYTTSFNAIRNRVQKLAEQEREMELVEALLPTVG